MMRRPDASFDDTLNRYLLDHFRHLLTEAESEIRTALGLNLKALQIDNPAAAKILAYARGLLEKPHVRDVLDTGCHESRSKIRTRLLNDHPKSIVVNRCPRCSVWCRTPDSRMCVACGHAWDKRECGEPSDARESPS
jgi:hypothetical protein